MKYLLKLINPLIYVINILNYFSHMDMHQNIDYEPYDFSKDIEYY